MSARWTDNSVETPSITAGGASMTNSLRTGATAGPFTRRQFAVGAVSAAAGAAVLASPHIARARAPFTLAKLPYADDALAPHISATTIGFHYGKHHTGYLTTLNRLVQGTPFADMTLEGIVKKTAGNTEHAAIFNSAAQVWNHTHYWESMKPKGGGKPSGLLLQKIGSDLGGWDKFVADFSAAAATQFASGWAWLVVDGGKLGIMKTGNADTPLAQGKASLLTIDVWEHAYYLDYQNRRGDYIKAWLENLVDWDAAAVRLSRG
jgi:Fe-Mn family superoxide dismutase